MENRERVIETVKRDIETALGPRLLSLYLYGSALTEEFVEKRSDYNFGLVAERFEPELLDRLAQRAPSWRGLRVPVPLLFTPKFFAQARDSFPLEFLAMKSSYRIVSGADLIADLSIEPRDVRLECEWELRSKLLLLRRVYVQAAGNAEQLRTVVAEAVPALSAIFRGLLFFRGGEWKQSGSALWSELDRTLGIPAPLMGRLVELRRRERTPSAAEVRREFTELLPLLERLVDEVDRW